MLIEFAVTNFRSIKERQALSMVAGPSAARRHQHSMSSGNSFAPHVLRSACVFGPNGAGKTSLVRAMGFFSSFVATSAKERTRGDEIAVIPFRADPSCMSQPSEFEIHFVFKGVLYQYGFSADRTRVREEWLFSRSNVQGSRIRTVFQRAYDEDSEEYEWNLNDEILKGERETWKKATRPNALFLSTSVQLNSESLADPYTWITGKLRVIRSPDRLKVDMTVDAAKTAAGKNKLLDLFAALDLPIVDFEAEEREFSLTPELEKAFSAEFLEVFRKATAKERDFEIKTFHDSPKGRVEYDLQEESDGTRVLFSLAGPLIEAADEGYTLVVDELHNSLHPLALKFLVGLFHDPEINFASAQIVFSSHDTAVMSKGFMHRDQIWLVRREESSGTELIPLSDFDVREVQSFQRAYLGGKFGALPNIRRWHLGAE